MKLGSHFFLLCGFSLRFPFVVHQSQQITLCGLLIYATRAEKRWLAGLLANEQAVGPLLKFLKSTEIGCREGTVERELEWEQRRDQEGENQLDD